MVLSLRRLSSLVFRRHSRVIAEINSNGMQVEWQQNNAASHLFSDRFELYDFTNRMLEGKGIDYLEFGVMSGETIFYWSRINEDENSRFFGFDSFEGLPEAWDSVRSKTLEIGHFNMHGKVPETEDWRIEFYKGLFQETLQDFRRSYVPQNPIVIHVDCDIYSSSLYVLTQMDEFIKAGTLVIFDEFLFAYHEFRAFMDYIQACGKKYEVAGAVLDTRGNTKFYEQLVVKFL